MCTSCFSDDFFEFHIKFDNFYENMSNNRFPEAIRKSLVYTSLQVLKSWDKFLFLNKDKIRVVWAIGAAQFMPFSNLPIISFIFWCMVLNYYFIILVLIISCYGERETEIGCCNVFKIITNNLSYTDCFQNFIIILKIIIFYDYINLQYKHKCIYKGLSTYLYIAFTWNCVIKLTWNLMVPFNLTFVFNSVGWPSQKNLCF